MTDKGAVRVECYSGHTYAQEPRAVLWQGQRHPVARVERRWRTPDGPAFCVRTEMGHRFELLYHEAQDGWLIRTLPETELTGQNQAKILPFPPRAVRPGGSKTTDEEVQY